MSEEIKNEEPTIDEKISELLNDPSVKTDEDKKFLKDVAESVKKGEVPVDILLNKISTVSSALNNLKKTNPEFSSFVRHYQTKMDEAIKQLNDDLKNESNGE
jgi:methanogenic corrinoid protein MtbC1